MNKLFAQLSLTMTLSLLATSAPAALDHEPLQRSDNLSFQQVFDSALANAPEGLAAASREDQAAQYTRLGDSLFPGQAVLETSYVDDSALDAVGLRELEAGLRLSLWRPGERRESQQLGQNFSRLYETWQDNLALEIAGQVRDSLWALQRADALLELERESLAISEQLEQLTAAQFAAGSVAERDLLQARALRMARQQAVHVAEAALVDAERDYTVLTGLNLRPAQEFSESRSTEEEIDLAHPLLQFLQANLQVASSRVSQVKRQAGESPTLSFGVRRERGNALDDYVDSLGIGFTMPIGRSAAVSSQVSDARREQADMQVALQRGHIMLDQRLHEAEHQLFTAAQQLELLRSQVQLSEQQWEMSRLAYELGETDALTTTMALRELLSARKQLVQIQIQYEQLISDYNQSLGLLP